MENGTSELANSACSLNRYSFSTTLLLGFITPFIIIFGVFANVLNFKIFTHKFMRMSMLNWYLAVLSVSDVIILATGFFFLSLPRIGEYCDNFFLYNAANTMALVSYPIGLVAQTCSVWSTILMSAHRFIGVCLPFKTDRICSKRNCRLALISVVAFSLVFNSSRFFELRLSECFNVEISYPLVTPNITALRQSDNYTQIYMVWCYTVVMFILPFVLLIGLNTAVLTAIQNTTKLHQSLGGVDCAMSKKREIAKEISTSVMLVGVVVVFLICNSLAFVVNVLEMVDTYRTPSNSNEEETEKFVDSTIFRVMVDISNVLVMLNASINIFVYSSFSEKFRLLLKHYLSFGCFRDSEPLIDSAMINNH